MTDTPQGSAVCVRCGNALGPDDFFEDGETRPHIIHNSDESDEHTEGPLCMRDFRIGVGLGGAMNPQEYRAGEHPTDRLDVSLSRAEIVLLLRDALPPLLDTESAYELRDMAGRAKQSLERALRDR